MTHLLCKLDIMTKAYIVDQLTETAAHFVVWLKACSWLFFCIIMILDIFTGLLDILFFFLYFCLWNEKSYSFWKLTHCLLCYHLLRQFLFSSVVSFSESHQTGAHPQSQAQPCLIIFSSVFLYWIHICICLFSPLFLVWFRANTQALSLLSFWPREGKLHGRGRHLSSSNLLLSILLVMMVATYENT